MLNNSCLFIILVFGTEEKKLVVRGYVDHIILNFIGGSVRCLLGSICRKLRGKKNYSFNEYLYGLEDSEDFVIDELGHEFNNKWIGVITIVIIALLFFKNF